MTMRAAVSHPRHHAVRAFSLIEMLIVIGLVVLLASITVVVGRSVIAKAKIDQCRQILQTLDATLTEYQADKGAIPPFVARAYLPPLRSQNEPSPAPNRRLWREIAVYLEQVKGYSGIDKQLGTIDATFLVERLQIYDDLEGYGYAGGHVEPTDDPRWLLPSVRDPWGMEILYIHPHADNENSFRVFGKPLNERPYFMSAGPDGVYETLEDNVYSYEVVKPGATNG